MYYTKRGRSTSCRETELELWVQPKIRKLFIGFLLMKNITHTITVNPKKCPRSWNLSSPFFQVLPGRTFIPRRLRRDNLAVKLEVHRTRWETRVQVGNTFKTFLWQFVTAPRTAPNIILVFFRSKLDLGRTENRPTIAGQWWKWHLHWLKTIRK